MVIDARLQVDEAKAIELERVFNFKRSLFIRAKHVFFFELVKEVPRLKDLRRALDDSIFSALFDKEKELNDYRPDYFHYNVATNMGLHGKFAENSTNEDNHNRLQPIAHEAACG